MDSLTDGTYIHTYIEFRVNKCNALQTLYSSQPNGKETEKRCVLRLDLNAGKVVDEVTSDGRLFQVFAAATGKARTDRPQYNATTRTIGEKPTQVFQIVSMSIIQSVFI